MHVLAYLNVPKYTKFDMKVQEKNIWKPAKKPSKNSR